MGPKVLLQPSDGVRGEGRFKTHMFWHCLQRTSVVKLRPTDYLYVIYHSNSPMTCNYNMWMRYNYNLPVRWCCDHTNIFTKMLLKVMFFLPLADTKSLWAQPLLLLPSQSHGPLRLLQYSSSPTWVFNVDNFAFGLGHLFIFHHQLAFAWMTVP